MFMGTVTPAHAASLTDGQIQAIINLLSSFGADQTIINNVNSSLRGIPSTNVTSTTDSCVKLSYNLYADQTDATTNGEVTRLQKFLARDSSIYPEGRVTGYFGPATEAAVQRWQAAHSIVSSGSSESTGYGYVGPTTRGKISSVTCGNLTVAIPTPTLTPTTIPTQIPTASPTPAPTAIPTVQSSPDISFQLLSPTDGKPLMAGQKYNVCWKSGRDNINEMFSFGMGSVNAKKGDGGAILGQAYLSQGCLSFVVPASLVSGSYIISANNPSVSLYSNSPAFSVVMVDTPTITNAYFVQTGSSNNINYAGKLVLTGNYLDKGLYMNINNGCTMINLDSSGLQQYISKAGGMITITNPIEFINNNTAFDTGRGLNALSCINYNGGTGVTLTTFDNKTGNTFTINNFPSLPDPIIDSFYMNASQQFSLSARNYNTLTFRSVCGNFVHTLMSADRASVSYPSGSESMCNGERYYHKSGSNSIDYSPAIYGQYMNLWNGVGNDLLDGRTSFIGNKSGDNNSGNVEVIIKACNTAGKCTEKSTTVQIYAKG